MSEYVIQEKSLTDIADAIREKAGSTEKMTPAEMAEAITAIPVGGGDGELKGLIDRTIARATVPSGVTKIGKYAFYSCYSLTNVALPEGLETIDEHAFHACNTLPDISWPSTLKTINEAAFRSCSKLAITSLPPNLDYLGSNAFQDCSLLAITVIPASARIFEQTPFFQCYGLKNITFKGTPSRLSNNTFSGCTNLTILNVPWAEGAVSGAPWGATNATINYNYTGG